MYDLNIENQTEYIVSCFTVPKLAVKDLLISANELNVYGGGVIGGVYNLRGTTNEITQNLIQLPLTIDGYTPKNQKLRQYPFTYLGFNPPNGTNKVFRYEDFTNLTPSFKIMSEVNPNPTVNIIPQNYRGQANNSMSDLCSLNGYPQLASKVDVYNSWLAENTGIINVETERQSKNAQIDMITGTASLLGSVIGMVGNQGQSGFGSVTGAGANLAKNTINYDAYIKGLVAQVERQQILPDNVTLGGSNATLLGYDLLNDNIFTRYSIKRQFAERIDKYFDMFGYQTNTLKVPNLNNRPNWNYVKTSGCNIIASIPQNDLETIKNMFDNGITLWHNTSTFLDYSQNNR